MPNPIHKVELFREEARNLVIEQHTPVQSLAEMASGIAKPSFFANISVQIPGPHGQPIPLTVRLNILADDIQHAFDEFDAQSQARVPVLVQQKVDELKAGMRRMALANAGPVPGDLLKA